MRPYVWYSPEEIAREAYREGRADESSQHGQGLIRQVTEEKFRKVLERRLEDLAEYMAREIIQPHVAQSLPEYERRMNEVRKKQRRIRTMTGGMIGPLSDASSLTHRKDVFGGNHVLRFVLDKHVEYNVVIEDRDI